MWNDNKLIWYILVLLSIFILFFLTLSQYNKLQENIDSKNTVKATLESKESDLNKLNELKLKVKSWSILEELSRYQIEYSEDLIIKYFYDYAFDARLPNTKIAIKNISFSEGEKNELGFMESKINLSVRFENEKSLTRFLNYLLWEEAKYVFFIDNFTYSDSYEDSSFDINLPLRLFYIK